jgi:hypothetical protein
LGWVVIFIFGMPLWKDKIRIRNLSHVLKNPSSHRVRKSAHILSCLEVPTPHWRAKRQILFPIFFNLPSGDFGSRVF